MLPAPLASLTTRAQWCLWRLTAGRKVPVSITGEACNPHDAVNRVTYAEAAAALSQWPGTGLAYVFVPGGNQWFLDIDKCIGPGGYSAIALEMMRYLSGAAVEISQSETGLHIIGTGTAPAHGCKNAEHGLEFYTELRFVALTGTGAIGDAACDLTDRLPALVERYFPPAPEAEAVEWSDQAVPEWSGPTDDAELIALMMQARPSVAAVLNGKATAAHLWLADPVALAASYPDHYGKRSYDASQADGALATHLAFWTGKNPERIRRLMMCSALRRDKWESNRLYLARTVRGAIGACRAVYTGGHGAAAALPVAHGDATAGGVTTGSAVAATGAAYMPISDQPAYFQGCTYVLHAHRVLDRSGQMLKPDQFRVMYGGYTFALDPMNEKSTRNAWEVFTESQAIRFPKADHTCFRPRLPFGHVARNEGLSHVNTYVPIDIPRVPGDVQPFTDHIAKMLPDPRDRAIFMAFLAALVQHKGVKFRWCPVLQGAEGNGKTMILRCLSYGMGKRYTHLPNARTLADAGNTFNSWLDGKLLIGIEEITVEGREDMLETLKPLIGDDELETQAKGVDQKMTDNCANVLMFCNHKRGMAVGKNKRRYCIFYTAQQSELDCIRDGMGGEYFPKMFAWLEAGAYAHVYDYLMSYAIPAELNPATLCHRAPKSSSYDEMVTLSASSIQQDIREAIDEGRQGFAGGWVSSTALDRLMQASGTARRVSHQKRTEVLKDMGYVPHPALDGGRVNNPIPLDGLGKPRLFVTEGHLSCGLTRPADVVAAYVKAQAGAVGMDLAVGAARG